mmetsp:Transcript_31661/g.42886  ORF Transcript_31661/g.42886 Transcript_31661/m.42886 type:complete len:291 (-) Transcript_31661:269-1141(-)|eukprot:CAMPEP_0185770784 /NCGR_PEP_ID=MMETSP1174-20130828/61133_1 /TAXON_ID=35687 /ORGANISM="Dictyocha speculum, Strain CCMP1381" /LENGTH=290 /DNA_ID=CAMNT_0028456361 /DNA_START=17 /DNA_END=889 /DNA_ORIENTATION=+
MEEEMLVLDPQIRDWVVLPMVMIMVLMGLTRHYVQQLLESDKAINIVETKNKQTLMRANKLRMNGGFIPEESFNMRKSYMVNKENGLLRAKVPKVSMGMMNPTGVVDMMKKNILFVVPNMVMMTIISYFFSGFVLVKVPFPLTSRFKVMLQRGVDLTTLDVSYVSSLSWYFLVMFGLRGLYKLILGEDSPALDEAKTTQAQMGMGMGGGMGFNAEAAFKSERNSLDLVKHTWLLNDAERTILGDRFPAKALMGMHETPVSADIAARKAVDKEEKKEKKRRQKTSKLKTMR